MGVVKKLTGFQIAALTQKLGRLDRIDDPKDSNHLVRMLATPKRGYAIKNKVHYDNKIFLNQPGNECTGFSATHTITDGPITNTLQDPFSFAMALYKEAQRHDEWPGENYEGSSVRGAGKALLKAGRIQRYMWAFDMQGIVDGLMRPPAEGGGPCNIGTNWYYSMFQADKNGLVSIGSSTYADLAGGHAYVLNGISISRGAYMKKRLFRFKNSWGQDWALNGRFWMTWEDTERLLHEQGEAMYCVENKVKLKIAA